MEKRGFARNGRAALLTPTEGANARREMRDAGRMSEGYHIGKSVI